MRPPLVSYSEGPSSVTLAVKRPTLRYLDEFMRLTCATDLLLWKVFPNAKEITESMAAYSALRRFCTLSLSDSSVVCVVVGDGCTPRTGALIACRSDWSVWSIDPRLKRESRVRRLTTLREPIEKADFPTPDVVVAVHSHAHTLPNAPLVISMPCCVPDPNERTPSFSYEDWGVWSPLRTINIYREAA